VSLEQAREAARLSVLDAISVAKAFLGDLDRIERVVKLMGFVSSSEDFYRQPEVIDGASGLLLEIFGPEKGSHARSAVGVFCLPFDLPVEIEMVLELKA
jgi:enamine deaminase RidA (YjgF/YER057c/UK114 family)